VVAISQVAADWSVTGTAEHYADVLIASANGWSAGGEVGRRTTTPINHTG